MNDMLFEKLLDGFGPILFDLASALFVEPINIKVFCSRLGISRTKAFEMKRKGILIKGRHYAQFGRKIIFPWGPELFKLLLEDCVICDGQIKTKEHVVAAQTNATSSLEKDCSDKKGRRTKAKTVIDKDYCTQH